MPRLLHGTVVQLAPLQVAASFLAPDQPDVASAMTATLRNRLHNFDLLFPDLQNNPANLLPVPASGSKTRDDLVALGRAMRDPFPPVGADPGDSGVPAAYTYFGQFIDHDITLEASSSGVGATSGDVNALFAPDLAPLPLGTIRQVLRNLRTASLDLDNVYGDPAPRDDANGHKMKLGTVFPLNQPGIPTGRPPGKDDFNDVPREQPSTILEHDRAALIGDPRNDENLIVSQLQVAFLRAHNRLVDQGHNFVAARRILRQHYQHLVLHDFLPRVADPAIVDDILQHGNKVFDPPPGQFFLPLEYTVAAYRFGHTMVRNAYNFNLNFNVSGQPNTVPATLSLLFTFTALSGQLGPGQGNPTLPENWIIQWENFVHAGGGVTPIKARRFDTKLAEPGLFKLQNLKGEAPKDTDPVADQDKARLALRNLLRGYLLRLPTGQAVATALGLTPLTAAEIEAAAASADQVAALQAGGFSARTPLWYYVLAEAAHGGGQHLGPVGSTIVAEVLIGLARRSKQSILTDPNWHGPTLPSAHAGKFVLADLLRFAGVLP
jgi:heme peroxidase